MKCKNCKYWKFDCNIKDIGSYGICENPIMFTSTSCMDKMQDLIELDIKASAIYMRHDFGCIYYLKKEKRNKI